MKDLFTYWLDGALIYLLESNQVLQDLLQVIPGLNEEIVDVLSCTLRYKLRSTSEKPRDDKRSWSTSISLLKQNLFLIPLHTGRT